MGEKTIPIFPCRSIETTWEFYRALGFDRSTWQIRPYAYLAVRRGDVELQFFGWKKHDPAASMKMCYVSTTDVDSLYEAFRCGLNEALGRVPTRGLPRVGALKDIVLRSPAVPPHRSGRSPAPYRPADLRQPGAPS